MFAINKTEHAGNVAFMKLTETEGKTAHLYIRIAVNARWISSDGSKREKVSFVPYQAFGNLAKAIAANRKKGDHILVDGEVSVNEYQGKEQVKLIIRKAQWDGRELVSRRNNTDDESEPDSMPDNDDVPVDVYDEA